MKAYIRIFITFSVLFLFVVLFSFPRDLNATVEYTVTNLALGYDQFAIWLAEDINIQGQVVGRSACGGGYCNKGFFWDPIMGVTILDVAATGINDNGIVVGYNSTGYGINIIWDSSTDTFSSLGTFNGKNTILHSINNNGQIVGSTFEGSEPFFWDPEDGFTSTPGLISGIANDVNDNGMVVGDGGIPGAFIWDVAEGTIDYIPSVVRSVMANSINIHNQVVGYICTDLTGCGPVHAFIWDEINGTEDLGTLGYRPPLPDDSNARDVNIHGQVVGYSNSDTQGGRGGWVGFIWDEVHGMRDLNELIPQNSGVQINMPKAINDSGQIVGGGLYNGEEIAFLLTPIPLQIVSIDIIPKTCPNECNIKGGGYVEVAILGTLDLDVTNIDIASVRLEGVAPTRSQLKDKSSPVVDPQTECECTTDGRDGYIDLCLKFDKRAIISALGEVNVDQEYVLTLTGELNDGTPIEGKDCIVLFRK